VTMYFATTVLGVHRDDFPDGDVHFLRHRNSKSLRRRLPAPLPQPISQPAQRLLGVLARAAGVVIEGRPLGQADPQLAEAVQAADLPAERQHSRPGVREGTEGAIVALPTSSGG